MQKFQKLGKNPGASVCLPAAGRAFRGSGLRLHSSVLVVSTPLNHRHFGTALAGSPYNPLRMEAAQAGKLNDI